MPAAIQRSAICPSCQRLTLAAWSRQIAIIDSVAPSARASGTFVPSIVMPSATTQVCSATRMPSTNRATRSRPDRSWASSSARACSVAATNLRDLGVEAIGLYQFHRPDPKVPFAESVGALAELRAAGKVRMVGLSNVSVDQINQARELVDVASVQNEFSPRFRRSEGELAWCAAHRIAFLPWSPLGGIGRGGMLAQRHPAFAEVAACHGVSPQQVALAWELAKAPVVIPIPGARRPASITDSAAAATLRLDDAERDRLDQL